MQGQVRQHFYDNSKVWKQSMPYHCVKIQPLLII